jgi:hypothetical protein
VREQQQSIDGFQVLGINCEQGGVSAHTLVASLSSFKRTIIDQCIINSSIINSSINSSSIQNWN